MSPEYEEMARKWEAARKDPGSYLAERTAALAALLDAAIRTEREACAKVCENMPHYDGHGNRVDNADYAAAIRARGGK